MADTREDILEKLKAIGQKEKEAETQVLPTPTPAPIPSPVPTPPPPEPTRIVQEKLLQQPPVAEIKEPLGVLTPSGVQSIIKRQEILERIQKVADEEKRVQAEKTLLTQPIEGSSIPVPKGVEAAWRGFSQGLSYNTVDELAAMASTMFGEDYQKERNILRARTKALEELYPKLYFATEIAGGMAADVILGVPQMGTKLKQILTTAGRGGAEAGLRTFGMTESEEPGQQLKETLLGAGTGVTVSAAMAALVLGLSKVVESQKVASALDLENKNLDESLKTTLERQKSIRAGKVLKMSPSEYARMERLPGGKPYVDPKTGEVVTDRKLRELGQDMLDEGILGEMGHKSYKNMYDDVIATLTRYGKLKNQVIKEADNIGLKAIKPKEFADFLEETIGETIGKRKVASHLLKKFNESIDDIRKLKVDKNGHTTFDAVDRLLRDWGKIFYKDNGELLANAEAADMVRYALKEKMQELLESNPYTKQVASYNKKYHNFKTIQRFIRKQKAGKMWDKSTGSMVDLSILGLTGMAVMAEQRPSLLVAGLSIYGLKQYHKRYGDQAQAKLMDSIYKKLYASSKLKGFAAILKKQASESRMGPFDSFRATHTLLYKRNKDYKEAIDELDEELKGSVDSDKKEAYSADEVLNVQPTPTPTPGPMPEPLPTPSP